MIRIRFHGRGGHGVKTASRIVGTAAFLAGHHVQDSPIYGAERRGAPVTAFTRIDDERILERGVIEHPDLIVVGDDTLLEDSGAGVLAGQRTASCVFVNAEPRRTQALARKLAVAGTLLAFDVTTRTSELVGSASALSAGLGAAASRLVGSISASHLREAVEKELSALRLPAGLVAGNVRVAEAVFAALPAARFECIEAPSKGEVVTVPRLAPAYGTPSIVAPGNATARRTGSWRVERPAIDYDRCTRCGICFPLCPDGVITLDEQGRPVIDYDHCKGCLICLQQCPLRAISATKEVRAWCPGASNQWKRTFAHNFASATSSNRRDRKLFSPKFRDASTNTGAERRPPNECPDP